MPQKIEMIKEIPLTACVPGVPIGTKGFIVFGPDYAPPIGKVAVEFDAIDLPEIDYEVTDDDESTIVIYVPIDFYRQVETK